MSPTAKTLRESCQGIIMVLTLSVRANTQGVSSVCRRQRLSKSLQVLARVVAT